MLIDKTNGVRYVAGMTGAFLLLFVLFTEGSPREVRLPSVRIMFYNVENLFDIHNDTLTDDDEFLPAGLRRWSYRRYSGKLNSLYKTIITAGEWDSPALAGFCEVENRKVLEDLVFGTPLARYDYGIIHEDSPDPRGIDVCLIYRRDLLVPAGHRYLIPREFTAGEFRTRSVLYAKFTIAEDTLHFFINHWPSRRGGVLSGETMRLEIAAMVRTTADSILARDLNAAIIIMGDFNAIPDDKTIRVVTGRQDPATAMVNLSDSLPAGRGTYRYRGTWEIIDQIIVSQGLLNCSNNVCTEHRMMKIFNPDFLLINDPGYPGPSPFSTFSGYRYRGGYSDHLPVLLDLKIRQSYLQE